MESPVALLKRNERREFDWDGEAAAAAATDNADNGLLSPRYFTSVELLLLPETPPPPTSPLL